MSAIIQRLQTPEPGKYVELFKGEIPGGPIIYVWNGNDVATFQGNAYQPYPVKGEGWEYNSQGVLPRPHLKIAKIDGAIFALMQDWDDLIGTIVTRQRTLFEFLDGQPAADSAAEYPQDIFEIDSVVSDFAEFVELELISPLDNESVVVPRRQIKANACEWVYRGPDCGYSGAPKADAHDTPLTPVTDRGVYNSATVYSIGDYVYVLINSVRFYYVAIGAGSHHSLTDTAYWVADDCSKCLRACKMRFGANNPLSFEGFPGVNKLPQAA